MKKIALTLLLALLSMSIFSQSITGTWNGALKIQGTQLRLAFNIETNGETFKSTMDSPDQGVTGIPCDETIFSDNVLKIKMSAIGASYEGTLSGDSVVGTFTQMGAKLPLNLSRSETGKVEIKRPQEPKPPFPYYTEEVKFTNQKDGVTLAGTLSLPSQKGKYPVVVMITGSGPQDRDEELLGHKPFLVIADYLTRNGIGVLRFDDRGVGESTGDFEKATSFDFANDVEAGVNYLLTRKDVNKKKIGLIGHSEGGLIAPMVASRNKNVAYIVLLAGPGVRGDELLLMQQEAISKVSGLSGEAIEANQALNKALFQKIVQSADTTSLRADLTNLMTTALSENKAWAETVQAEQANALTQQTVNQLLMPWMLNFIKYDPIPTLRKVKCPVLALNGSNDLQVPATENLSAIQKAFQANGRKNQVTMELEGLNHLFQESATGSPAEYGTIEQTFSPKALSEILNWVKKR